MIRKWQIEELSELQQDILQQVYGIRQPRGRQGYMAKKVSYVRELTEYEKRIFVDGMALSPNFLTQSLYKIHGSFTPMRFNRVLHTMINEMDILRTNYCSMGEETLAIVFEERKDLPKIVYQNVSYMDGEEIDRALAKAMEADMREGVDLRQGNILRFMVFHTGENEYAVLATVAQALLDRVDMREVFLRAIGREVPSKDPGKEDSDGAKRPALEGAVQDYWSNMLSDPPQTPILPYGRKAKRGEPYRQRVYRRLLPADIMSDLREKAKSNRMMLMAILQTAWGFMLQECNTSCRDVLCCLLVPGRKASGDQRRSSAFNMMPARMKSSEQMSVQKQVAQQFQQILVSQPYSDVDWGDLKELTRGRGRLFDHFLSFFDFMTEEQQYSEAQASPEGTLVKRDSWDAQGGKLSVYFRYVDGRVSFSIMYDERHFAPDGGSLLANRYLLVLQQMITDWNLGFVQFMGRLSRHIAENVAAATQRGSESERLLDILHSVKLLQNVEKRVIQDFGKSARLERRFEGDRVSGSVMENCLVFVVSGKLARNVDTGDGWYNPLDILKEGDWVNETIFLVDRKSHSSAEVLTEEAEILLCPIGGMRNLMSAYPEFMRSVLQHLARQLEKYQRLWMQA